MITITTIHDAHEKASIVSHVLADLAEWFGLPDSTQNYIDEARALPLLVAQDEHAYVGFITLKETSTDTVEIHCMGIKKHYHRQGIGRALFEQAIVELEGRYDLVQVKTVDEGHYDEYDQTNAFYAALGFKRLEVFPDMWDPWNPCLILVKVL